MLKINLNNIDQENFSIKEGIIGGEIVYLINPCARDAKWTNNNLIYRSSIWNKNGEPVSLSFKKFFNWFERPDLTFTPNNSTNCNIIEKIDGSLLCVSKYKDNLIIRTRGTFDATKLENGHEIELLKNKYPKAFNNKYIGPYSLIFEWVTPTNKIILNYGDEPALYFIGMIDHLDYSYIGQKELDLISKEIDVARPIVYNFNSISNMIDEISLWKGKEGCCVYCNNDQDIRKLKSEYYLKLHRLKEELGSFEKVVDFYVANNYPSFNESYNIIANTLDFEVAEQCRGDLSRICDAYKNVEKIIAAMKNFVDSLKNLSRKEAAEKIIKNYGQTNRASFCFCLLDNKELTSDQIKKLLYQSLKK